MKNRLIEIFTSLISINALSTREKPVADFIRDFFADYPAEIYSDNCNSHTDGQTGNLICRFGNGGNTMLLAHMDTARPTDNVQPVITENLIKSDGASVLGVDNRAGIAILLYALEKFYERENKVPDITLAFTICEETTLTGSRCLNVENIDFAFSFDSALRPGHFINRSYGAMSFKAEIFGKASHSGISPEKGINAIAIAAKAISAIATGRLNPETIVNIGKIRGGEGINIVPALTVVEGEIRSLNIEEAEMICDQIKSHFEQAARPGNGLVKFSSYWDFHSYTFNNNEKIISRISDVLTLCGLEPVASVSAGGSDANSLNANGIPTINLGIGAQNPHSNDEFIYIRDLEDSAKIAYEILKQGFYK